MIPEGRRPRAVKNDIYFDGTGTVSALHSPGQTAFTRGQPINLAGRTGVVAPNPPHLHFHTYTTIDLPHGGEILQADGGAQIHAHGKPCVAQR